MNIIEFIRRIIIVTNHKTILQYLYTTNGHYFDTDWDITSSKNKTKAYLRGQLDHPPPSFDFFLNIIHWFIFNHFIAEFIFKSNFKCAKLILLFLYYFYIYIYILSIFNHTKNYYNNYCFRKSTKITITVRKRRKNSTEAEDDTRLCIICLQAESTIIIYPCGHFYSCVSCALFVNKCGICRGKFTRVSNISMYIQW
jgi:hypothetical protein